MEVSRRESFSVLFFMLLLKRLACFTSKSFLVLDSLVITAILLIGLLKPWKVFGALKF